jgi:hypothetical protein
MFMNRKFVFNRYLVFADALVVSAISRTSKKVKWKQT